MKTSGLISPDKWGNLPGGEVFTTPGEVNGTFVIDGVVGDYLCSKYGDLRGTPLTIQVADNRIVDLRSENKELLDDFRAYTSTDENSNRVGEFAIGTNTAISTSVMPMMTITTMISTRVKPPPRPGARVVIDTPTLFVVPRTDVSVLARTALIALDF